MRLEVVMQNRIDGCYRNKPAMIVAVNTARLPDPTNKDCAPREHNRMRFANRRRTLRQHLT